MSDSNRRGFLIAAGATAAGVAALAQVARSDDAADSADVAAGLPGGEHREIVAHVHDVRTGAISLMVEGQQVSVTDPALAARIAAAMRRTTA